MSIGFDEKNLTAAVKMLMELAITKSPTKQIIGTEKNFDVTDEAQVTDFLITKAQEIYDQQGPGGNNEIRAGIYASMGITYGENLGEMHPPPVTRSTERPKHLAFFWQVL